MFIEFFSVLGGFFPVLSPFLSFGFLPVSFEFPVSHNVAATPLWQEHSVCVPSLASSLLWLWLFLF